MAAFLTMGLLKIWGGIPVGYFLWQVSPNAITLMNQSTPLSACTLKAAKPYLHFITVLKPPNANQTVAGISSAFCRHHHFYQLRISKKERLWYFRQDQKRNKIQRLSLIITGKYIGRNCQAAPIAIGIAEAGLIQSGFSPVNHYAAVIPWFNPITTGLPT